MLESQDALRDAHPELCLTHVLAALRHIYKQQGGPELLLSVPARGSGVLDGLAASRAPRWTDVLVRDVRFTHDRVAGFFRHGAHAGEPVSSLTAALEEGRTSTSEVPLVCVRLAGVLHSLFNRRLKALRDFDAREAQRGGPAVAVPALVVEADPITAKFVLSFSAQAGELE